jgi:hypothetical protein
MNNSETDISCDKTQQDGFVLSRISVFASCTGSSSTKLLPHAVSMVQFGQKLPVLALVECRLELTPEENQRHLSRTSESKWACTFLQPFDDKSH